MKNRKIIFDALTVCFLLLSAFLYAQDSYEESLAQLLSTSLWAVVFFVVGGSLSLLMGRWNIVTFGDVLFKTQRPGAHERSRWPRFWIGQFVLVLGLALVIAFQKSNFSMMELLQVDGFNGAMRLFKGLFNPNWEVLPRAVMNMTQTIFMAFLATFLAIPVAFFLSFLSAKNIMQSPLSGTVYFLLRLVMNVTRSVEALIWAIIFSIWVGIGPFAGMLALMIHSVASLTKQFSEAVESVEEGPMEAIASTGASRVQIIWFGIVPQVLLSFISFAVYRWDINVRMATIIGLVGGGGIGTMLMQYQGQALWPEVGCIIFVIAIVVWVLDLGSAYIREALK